MDPRYDKVNPEVGLFRAPLAADLPTGNITASGSYGPACVSLNASGQVVIGTAGQSGFVGVLVKNRPQARDSGPSSPTVSPQWLFGAPSPAPQFVARAGGNISP